MRVVVPGGSGFIGTYVIKRLATMGVQVRVIDISDPPILMEGIEFLRLDLADRSRVTSAFEGADACINLAALSGGIAYLHSFPATILDHQWKPASSSGPSPGAQLGGVLIPQSEELLPEHWRGTRTAGFG